MTGHATRLFLVLGILAVAPASLAEDLSAYQRPPAAVHPAANAWSPEREALGRALFFDPRLSRSNTMSCATCHNPGFDYGDPLPLSLGDDGKPAGRRTPTLLNLAWADAFFWDGRAASLEEQALGPIASPAEMNLPIQELVARLQSIAEYRPLFEAAYPDEPIDEATAARALAVFQRTLVSAEAPFDRWVRGDERAVSADAKRGFELFVGKARCALCHSGWRFTDDSFHDIGLPGNDRGRAAVHPGVPTLEHAFKTPTLRNVSRRAPYMHDGSVESLREVLALYVEGGRVKRPSLSGDMAPVELDEREIEELLAFLDTLTSADVPASIPNFPR